METPTLDLGREPEDRSKTRRGDDLEPRDHVLSNEGCLIVQARDSHRHEGQGHEHSETEENEREDLCEHEIPFLT